MVPKLGPEMDPWATKLGSQNGPFFGPPSWSVLGRFWVPFWERFGSILDFFFAPRGCWTSDVAFFKKRYQNHPIFSNAQLHGGLFEQYTQTTKAAALLLKEAFSTQCLSARAWSKLLKVSKSIADLESAEKIEENHLLEALSYRFHAEGAV